MEKQSWSNQSEEKSSANKSNLVGGENQKSPNIKSEHRPTISNENMRRGSKDSIPSHFLIDSLWTRDPYGNGELHLMPEMFIENGQSRGKSGVGRDEGSPPIEQRDNEEKPVRLAGPRHSMPLISGRAWTIDSLASYVQYEFSNIITRIHHLEAMLGRTLSSEGYDTLPPDVTNPLATIIPANMNRNEISRSQLDRHCIPVLEKSPEPSANEIGQIAQALGQTYINLDRKTISSHIRKWFRKRREEMGARIVSSLKRHYGDKIKESEEVEEFWEKLRRGKIDLRLVMRDARLEISDQEVAKCFVIQKINSFLNRIKLNPTSSRSDIGKGGEDL